MKGCIQLFPRSIAADECEKALAKEAGMRKGGHLSKWDERMLSAIRQLERNEIDTVALEAVARQIKLEKKSWMRAKGYCR